MVRFIIVVTWSQGEASFGFTFQYGQIYYSIFDMAQKYRGLHLHSNMVRFIINKGKIMAKWKY